MPSPLAWTGRKSAAAAAVPAAAAKIGAARNVRRCIWILPENITSSTATSLFLTREPTATFSARGHRPSLMLPARRGQLLDDVLLGESQCFRATERIGDRETRWRPPHYLDIFETECRIGPRRFLSRMAQSTRIGCEGEGDFATGIPASGSVIFPECCIRPLSGGVSAPRLHPIADRLRPFQIGLAAPWRRGHCRILQMEPR